MENDKYIGRLLDNRYEILEVIGSGGMAVVYKARCHRLNRLVAVKILKDDNLEDEDFRRRFHAESQAVAMLSHPNIVSIYDVSTSVMADYIVMELCEGITLKQYMEKKGILNWKETLHFAMQIAKALEHAHSKGIVHRDIKPHNVMVLKNGSVKVMDFGIARMISRGNTLTKEALGSVHYISPEQARGGRVDDRSDIYSLGVVMYEMMAGRPPYDGESPVSVAIQHINGGASLPSLLNPNIPGGLEQIIMKAMAHNVSDRYPSATRMLADMDEFRKEPTILFDYTGLPIDAATRVQSTPLTMQPLKDPTPKSETPQNPAKKPVTELPPSERRRQDPSKGSSKEKSQDKPQGNSRRRPSQAQAKRSRITLIAIISCSVVAVIAIGILLWLILGGGLKPKEEFVKIPNLVGMTYSKDLAQEGLTIHIKKEFSDTVEAGKIIRQEPAAGESVKKSSNMIVYVSQGPEVQTIEFKDLKLSTKEEAIAYLDAQQIPYQLKEENSDVKKDSVIRTEPEGGKTIAQGQTVTVYVSKGPKNMNRVPMLDGLVGDTEENARKRLDAQKMALNIVTEEEPNMDIPAGTVLRTNPTAGEGIAAGDTVTLYVSSGVAKVAMPDLSGKTKTEAIAILHSLGFLKEPTMTYVASNKNRDEVVFQSLEKDKEYEITTQVELQLSDGSLVPVEKHVTLSLQNYAKNSACHVQVRLENTVLYAGTVPKGTTAILLRNQINIGSVVYKIYINDGEYILSQTEVFANEVPKDDANNATNNQNATP